MISKSRFMNLIRCPRYCALAEIKDYRNEALVSFSDIAAEEQAERIKDILQGMYDVNVSDIGEEEEIDLIDKPNEQMAIMLPYYNKVEMLAGEAIKNRFGGDVIYSSNTYEQKHFSVFVNDYKFHCFIDGYQEQAGKFNIFEVKSTTSNKFMNLGAAVKGEKVSIFEKTSSGIIKLKEELYDNPEDYGMPAAKYYANRATLFNKYKPAGKYVYDLAFQRFVIEKGLIQEGKEHRINDVKYYLVVLNPKYIYDGKEFNDEIVEFIDLTQVTKEMLEILQNDVNTVMKYLDEYNAEPCPLGKDTCGVKSLRECKFKSICFNKLPKKNSILTYMGNHNGFVDEDGNKHLPYELINEGYYTVHDVPEAWLTRDANIIQRRVIDTKRPYINENRIQKCVHSLHYPIYHLDFESFPCPIPRFNGEKPYTQSLFQYSIHVETAPGVCDKELDHKGFLSTDNLIDEREDLVDQMLSIIDTSKPCTVLVYNESFEKSRIKELAQLYPHRADELLKINEYVVDLMYFLRGNKKLMEAIGCADVDGFNYYHEALQGSFSIKKVLPIFSDLTYEGMGVANGTEAMVTYASFNMLKNTNIAEYNQKIEELTDYCKQDTWAMVEILKKLREF